MISDFGTSYAAGPLTPEQKASRYKKTWANAALYKFWDLTKNAKFGELTAWANTLDQNGLMNLWSFFNLAESDEVSLDALSNANQSIRIKSNKMDVTSFLVDLGKNTNFKKAAGFNNNDSLGYEEFKGLMTAFAIVDAQTIILTFDANYNAIMDSNETRDFFVFRGYEDSDGSMLLTTDHNEELKEAWSNATNVGDMDGAPVEQRQQKLIANFTKFVITEWGLLIDYGLLIFDDGNSEDDANDAEND